MHVCLYTHQTQNERMECNIVSLCSLSYNCNAHTHGNICVNHDVWCMMYDVCCVMCDVWCVMYDVWCMMCDVWCVMCECVMYDVWCIMYDVWCMMYTILARTIICDWPNAISVMWMREFRNTLATREVRVMLPSAPIRHAVPSSDVMNIWCMMYDVECFRKC